MSEPTRVNFVSLEQAIVADVNRAGSLAGKAVLDRMLEIEQGIYAFNPRNCTLRGLIASVGAGMSVNISSGSLARLNVSPPANQSRYSYAELAATTNVLIPAADVLPRVDLIHVAEAQVTADVTTRTVIALPARNSSPQNIPKTQQASMNLAVVSGTPSATPAIPATPAGRVGIWAVYIPAGAVAVTDNFLIDLRVVFLPSSHSRAHHRESGLYVGNGTSFSDVFVSSGRGFVNGGQLDLVTDLNLDFTDLTSDGATPIAANSIYHVYLVGAGHGDPVGKNVPSRVVPIATTVAPNPDGRPSAGILYRPLFPHGIDNLRATTVNALYIGTLHSDASSGIQAGGDGIPLNRDGTAAALNIAASPSPSGFPGRGPGWIKQTDLQWVDANTVRLPLSVPVIGGVVGIAPPLDAVMPSSLVLGEVETNSTWYYAYLRTRIPASAATRGTVRNYVLMLSAEAPSQLGFKPTPEAGFATFDYLFAGSAFNDGSGNFSRFTRCVGRVLWTRRELLRTSADCAIAPAFTTVTSIVPLSARAAIITINGEASPGAGVTTFLVYPLATIGTNRILTTMDPGANSWFFTLGPLDLEVTPAGLFRINRVLAIPGLVVTEINQPGYLESIETPFNPN